MIVRQRDYYRDRMGSKELLDPFIPHKSGASEDIVFREDVFEPEKSYADPGFGENIWEREATQLIPFVSSRPIGGWWSDIWTILSGWITKIEKFIGPLIDLYKQLEDAGIITHEQAEQAEAEGWTKEQLISLIKAQMAPTWQTYLPWIIAGGIGVGLLAVLLRRPAPIYVAK